MDYFKVFQGQLTKDVKHENHATSLGPRGAHKIGIKLEVSDSFQYIQ